MSSAPAWWRQWDGLPPWLERLVVDANERRERRSAGVTGWRRWFVRTSLWPPVLIGAAQVLGLTGSRADDGIPWLRAGLLAYCVLYVVAILVARRTTPSDPS